MSSIIRFASIAAALFSVGVLVSALPVAVNATIQAPVGTDVVSRLCAKLVVEGQLEAHLKALLLCVSIEDLKVKAAVVVELLKACAQELLAIDAKVVVDAQAQVSLVGCLVGIITLCVQVLVQVSLKFGLAVCADIDAVLRLLLVNINLCVDGILVLVAKALASVTIGLLAQVNLKLCLGVLGL
ncbi:hypothetical protein OPQ81_011919 [Rhizoctonia solani]|nr:hypothetical protein OPQ81_011919 [Rhizoctonia solani]